MEIQAHQRATWAKIPVDIILEMITHLPFSPETLSSLSRTNKHLHTILTTYERSISATIIATQYPTASAIFPLSSLPALHSPSPTPHPTYAYLATLHNRTTTITHLNSLLSPSNPTSPLHIHHRPTHWTTLLTAGLHILYRLCDIPTYAHKITYLHTHLPLQSLALLHLTLFIAIKTAEQRGTGIIHASVARGNIDLRVDVSFAFAECVLLHGPSFLLDILTPKKNDKDGKRGEGRATRILFGEWCDMDRKQTRWPKRSLTSWLNEAFARRDGCAKTLVTVRMWKTCQGRELWGLGGLGEEGVVGLVNAGVVQGGG